MPQQLNLYARNLCQSQQPNALGRLLLGQGALAVVALALGGALQWHAHQLQQETQALATQTDTRRSRLQHTATSLTEQRQLAQLQRLREREAATQRLQALLANGSAGRREGYADYLEALARQAHPAVWITGLKLQGGGDTQDAIELQGRMTDPAVLPDYLRSLQAEPQFKGRPFATLQIRRGGAGSAQTAPALPLGASLAIVSAYDGLDTGGQSGTGPDYSEFTLSSQPPAGPASKP